MVELAVNRSESIHDWVGTLLWGYERPSSLVLHEGKS